jgi:hypothetical protein
LWFRAPPFGQGSKLFLTFLIKSFKKVVFMTNTLSNCGLIVLWVWPSPLGTS